MATNAIYKRYDGSEWVEYHFKTNAAQVIQTTGTGWRKFISAKVKINGQPFDEVTTGEDAGGATVTLNASHLYWYSGTKPSTNYLSDTTNVQAALQALDTAAKAAYDNIPSGILTTSNFSTNNPDLSAIEELSGTSGFLKKTATNTWALDTETYVPTSRTVNGKALSANVLLSMNDIYLRTTYNPATGTTIGYGNVGDYIESVKSLAIGRSRAIAISHNDATSASSGKTKINSYFNSQDPEISFSYTFQSAMSMAHDTSDDSLHTDKVLITEDGSEVDMGALKVGDNVFVTQTNVPDRWVSAIIEDSGNLTVTIKFAVLETQKVDLEDYATKATTLAGYGITDAKIENGTITLGSNTITPLTSHQSLSGLAPTSHASSSTTYGVGTTSNYGHVKLSNDALTGSSSNEDGVACGKGHTHSQYALTSNVAVSQAGTSFSGTAKAGDIWIDTTTA